MGVFGGDPQPHSFEMDGKVRVAELSVQLNRPFSGRSPLPPRNNDPVRMDAAASEKMEKAGLGMDSGGGAGRCWRL